MNFRKGRAKKRNNRKRNHLISFGLLGLILLLSHQNCAPQGMVTANHPTAAETIEFESPLPVTIIDESKKVAALAFPYGEIELSDDAGDVTLLGSCHPSQEGAVFGWSISSLGTDGSSEFLIDHGQATCTPDRYFAVPVVSEDLSCGRSYKAVAQLGYGQPAEVILHRPCH